MNRALLTRRLACLVMSTAALIALAIPSLADPPVCDAAADRPAPPDRLEVASYNVQFVTPDIPVVRHLLRELPGHKPNVQARARAIADRLACFDIIALQETINDVRREEIFEALERRGRACGKPSRLPSGRMFEVIDGPDLSEDGGWLPLLDDELALASRLPVVEVGTHVFGDAAGTDALAAKGVLYARLAHGDAVLDVFTTHLQAGAEHAQIRRQQIAELASIVRRTARQAAPVLVLGDFNLWGGNPDRADPRSEYNFLLRALNDAVAPGRFVDLWLETHPGDPETDSGTKPRLLADGTRRPREKRIDFVFLAGNGHAIPRAMRHDFLRSDLMVDGEPVGYLSSHAALVAQVDWLDETPPCARLSTSSAR